MRSCTLAVCLVHSSASYSNTHSRPAERFSKRSRFAGYTKAIELFLLPLLVLTFLASQGWAQTYPPVSDTFTGSGSLSSNWTNTTATGETYVAAAQFNGTAIPSVSGQQSFVSYTGATFTSDQYSQAKFVTHSSAVGSTGPCVHVTVSGDGVCYLGDYGIVYLLNNGVGQREVVSNCPIPSSGDVIQLSVQGNTYKCTDITTGASSSNTDISLSAGAPGMLLDQRNSAVYALAQFQADCIPSCSTLSSPTVLSLGSFATTASNPGFDNTSTSYLPSQSTVDNSSNATYGLGSGIAWHSALGASTYVSYDPNSGPEGSVVPPNGDYIYTTTFTMPSNVDPASAVGTLTLLADDTVDVYLNGMRILESSAAAYEWNRYSHCSDIAPNCVLPYTFQFTGITSGQNTLTFDVKQVNGYGEGLDYIGSVHANPSSQLALSKLTLASNAPPPYVTGTAQQFVAKLQDHNGTALPGIAVTFSTVGANATTGSATTDANGNAVFTYTGSNSGIDTIHASASVSGQSVNSNDIQASWLVPIQPISTTEVSAEFFFSDNAQGFDTPPTATPAFVQSFPTINVNPPQGTVPGNNSGVGIASRPFTDVTTDVNGNFTGTIVAQGNGYQAGVGPLVDFQAVFRGAFTVRSAGNVVFTFFNDDGFTFGIGNGATRVSGVLTGMPSVTPFSLLPVVGGTSLGGPPSGQMVVVNFPNPGTYPYEVDYSECCGGPLALTMTYGSASPTGIPPSGSLTLTPNIIQPLPAGGQQTFIAVATDASGAPMPGASIGLVIKGVDTLELNAITDASGHATFLYRNRNAGTASAQAVAFIGGMLAYSNTVTVPWTLPPSTQTTSNGSGGTISVSISALQTITLPNTLQLNGTVTDSNLPPGGTLAIAWTQISGPGTVTFANPQQATTTATFSQAGTYTLQLSANDSVTTGSAQIQVDVNPVPGVTQGWIGSPADGATISGVFPISVGSGVSLQSGTLTYYPSSNFNNVTVLNANTTGSGQIGTLDTTLLANGQYWIELRATDATGHLQENLALVTVAGNYKPGRVTSKVTDLVVPATGLAINIERTYDSLKVGTISDFGYGWSLGTTVDLTVGPKGDVSFTLGGARRTFYFTPQYGGWFLSLYFPAFTPEPGFFGTLTASGPGCATFLDLLVPDGSLWTCIGDGSGFYTPPGYIYTDPSGTQYTISANGTLQSIVDRNGNALTITPSGITSSTGLSVPFVRDANGRITKITDPQGHQYIYSYDSSGNLASVQYPGISQPSIYTYTANHHYSGGTDARGNPLPTTNYYPDGRLQSVTNALGQTTSYAYDLTTNTTTITHPPDGSGTVGTATMVYDSYGMLLSSTDLLGHKTTNVYDSKHNLISVTDPLNHTTTYTYDSNGNRTSVTYPQTAQGTNTTSTTTYNQFSEPTSTTDELGNVRAFTYDANYNPQSVTDAINGQPAVLSSFLFNANGTMAAGAVGIDITTQPSKASQFTYDANGNITSRTDALGRTTSYTYDNLGRKESMTIPLPTSNTNPAAATTTYQYDALGHLTQTSAPLGRTTSSEYDSNGNKTSDTDALGHTTTYQYDALNRLTTTTYPTSPSTTTTRTYDFRNNVIDETDQAGHITHHVYDLAGRLTSVTKAFSTSNANTTTYTYYDDGRKHTEMDALGHTTTYIYDVGGRLTGISGVLGNFSYGYDAAGNRISSTDGNGYTTQYQYDARKRLTKTIYPDSNSVTNIYDGPGNLIKVTDQAGNAVQYDYDAANQLQTVVQLNHPDSSHNTTSYAYDKEGNLTNVTDGNGHSTVSSFDLLSQLTTRVLPDGSSTETRTYDNAGNPLSWQHFNGATTSYSYDPLNRLLTQTPDPSYNEPAVTFIYTSTGKRASMTDASGTTNYTYDSLDRLTSKSTQQGTLNYTYDAVGNVASMMSTNANGVSVSYTYDSLNRLSTVTDNRLTGSNLTTYTYDTASNLATVTYPNGLQSTFSYDQQNRLTSMTASTAGYLYTLGPTGNRTNAAELSGRSLTWNYDGIYRLTSETISTDPAGKNGSVAYGLDPVGNRLSETSTLSGISSGSYSFNINDLLSIESYDANGNVIASGGKSFTYDSENRLKSMNGGAVTLQYDGDGNRVAKTVSGVTTRYLVDDLNPTGYSQVVEEIVNGTVKREYTYGLQRIGQNQIIDNVWTSSFYGYDGMGNVRRLISASGTVTDTNDYDAFGNKLASTGTTPNIYLYRGEQYDPDLGLYYLRARYYNPATGRFMSRDPESGIPTDPQTLHKYAYADGDPVNRVDPTGRSAVAEDVEVTVKIDVGTLLSVEALGCTVKLAYNVLALKAVNDFDITPTSKCGAKGKGRMRIQLQSGTTVTIPGTPVLIRDDPPGVTKADAYAGLLQLWGLAQGGQSGFPFNANQSDLWSAIISVSKCVKRQTGTAPGIYTVCQAYLTSNTGGWRIDLENLNGVNLRQ